VRGNKSRIDEWELGALNVDGKRYGRCKGLESGMACSRHEECDIDQACRRDMTWPHSMRCMPQAPALAYCDSDYDCQQDHVCWYLDAGHV